MELYLNIADLFLDLAELTSDSRYIPRTGVAILYSRYIPGASGTILNKAEIFLDPAELFFKIADLLLELGELFLKMADLFLDLPGLSLQIADLFCSWRSITRI